MQIGTKYKQGPGSTTYGTCDATAGFTLVLTPRTDGYFDCQWTYLSGEHSQGVFEQSEVDAFIADAMWVSNIPDQLNLPNGA